MRRIWLSLVIGGVILPCAAALAAAAGFRPFLTMWGGHGSAPGLFSSPDMIAVDVRGQVYVADRQNNRVEKFDYRGHLLSIIGSAGSAPGQFSGPRGVAVDGVGDLYVADSANRIEKFDASGSVLAEWGRNDGDGLPGAGAGEFNRPRGVTVDRFGDVYVADKENNRIQKFDARGRFLLRWGRDGGDGRAGNASGQFRIPYSVAAGPDQVYVADTGNNRLQEFTFAGRFIRRLGRNGGDGSPGKRWASSRRRTASAWTAAATST